MKRVMLGALLISALLMDSAAAQVAPAPAPTGSADPAAAQQSGISEHPVPSPPPPFDYDPVPAFPPPSVPPIPPPPPEEGRIWVNAEALAWWIEGAHVPSLLVTNPAGTPAGVGSAAQTSLFGPGDVTSDWRPGMRLNFGGYLDPNHCYAVEGQFFLTAAQTASFGASSPGTPILERPFTDVTTGLPALSTIAAPGVASGSAYANYSSSGLLGAGIWVRENIVNDRNPMCHCGKHGGCCDDCQPSKCHWHVDGLLGYRYLRLGDHLDVDTTSTAAATGVTTSSIDQIRSLSTFNGVDMGFIGEVDRGPWFMGFTTKIALGSQYNSVNLSGAHTLSTAAGTALPGGFLVQPSNAGHGNQQTASSVPELDLRFGYRFSPRLRVYAGYTLLYMFHVARSGDQLDPNLNPNFLTAGTVAPALASPALHSQQSAVSIQGANVGIEFRY